MEYAKSEAMDLPPLEVEKLFYLEARCAPKISIGDIGGRELNIFPIIGGFFEGEKMRGEIMNLGADWNYRHSGNLAEMITRYLLKTDDGEYISLSTNGRYVNDWEKVLAIRRGEYIDPNQYYFRQHLVFETGAEKYKWLNGIIAFAVMGIKETGEICYNAYMLK